MTERQQRTEELNKSLFRLNLLIAKLFRDPSSYYNMKLREDIVCTLTNSCSIANNMRFLYVDEIISYQEENNEDKK